MNFSSLKQWVEFFRDIGFLLGVPGFLLLGYKVFNRHIQALKEAHKAHIDAMESENRLLKETSYDRALALIEAQKTLFHREREELEKEIEKLKLEQEIKAKVNKTISVIYNSRNIAFENLAKSLSKRKLKHIAVDSWEDFLPEYIDIIESYILDFNKNKPKDENN